MKYDTLVRVVHQQHLTHACGDRSIQRLAHQEGMEPEVSVANLLTTRSHLTLATEVLANLPNARRESVFADGK